MHNGKTFSVFTALALLVGCGSLSGKDSSDAVDPVERWGPPTDTTPSFYGSVPKNILMLSVDTFRKDSLSRYGGPAVMPFLDELASTGFTADDHLTCSNWTFAGTTCTLLGRYNIDAGFTPHLPLNGRERVPDATPFLATWLGEAGYYSVLITGNSWLSPEWNNTQGYDYVHDPDYDHAPWMAEDAFDRLARAQITGQTGETDPWFLHVHLMEPHAAYRPPEEYLAGLDSLEPLDVKFDDRDEHYDANAEYYEWSEDEQTNYLEHLWVRYRGELSYTDDLIQNILAQAGSRGLLKDTMVVIWNDHGEQMFEHGLQTHAHTLHGEENDGLLVFWARNIVPGSWEGPTTSIDLAPTLLALQGIEQPAEVTGVPLGSAETDRARFGWSVGRGSPESSVTKDGWKLIFEWSGATWLYDRNADPAEAENLYTPDHPRTQELWELLRPQIEKASPLFRHGPIAWPDESTSD
jgi:arylsulfatase A-like enzyme